MLLNELNQTALDKFVHGRKLLESSYGVKIKPSTDLHKLYLSASKAQSIMENLKYQNNSINDAEVSKYSLINETVMSLIKHKYDVKLKTLLEFEGIPSINVNSNKFRKVLDSEVAKAINNYDAGMPVADVASNAMHSFRNTPGVIIPDDVFKIEFEQAFLKKLYFSGREPEAEQPTHFDTSRPTSTLLSGMSHNDIMEAIEEMKSITDGVLKESDVDYTNLQAIAEALIESFGRDDYLMHRQGKQKRPTSINPDFDKFGHDAKDTVVKFRNKAASDILKKAKSTLSLESDESVEENEDQFTAKADK